MRESGLGMELNRRKMMKNLCVHSSQSNKRHVHRSFCILELVRLCLLIIRGADRDEQVTHSPIPPLATTLSLCFQTACQMTSCPSVFARGKDDNNPNLYYSLAHFFSYYIKYLHKINRWNPSMEKNSILPP